MIGENHPCNDRKIEEENGINLGSRKRKRRDSVSHLS